ncbi:hypothetical protein [Paenibacillus sp. MMO-58]|uniref:hypothetical protein n=1 Tax=Paenibacillus sp. MMO-58 TaxID=3081290 RepID=UPI0030164FFB
MKRHIDIYKPLNHYFIISDDYAEAPISLVERYADPNRLPAIRRVLRILQGSKVLLFNQLLDFSYFNLLSFRNLGETSLNHFLEVLKLACEDPELLQHDIEPIPSILVQLREKYEKRNEIPYEEIERRKRIEGVTARLRELGLIT